MSAAVFRRWLTASMAVLLLCAGLAQAGTSCEQRAIGPLEIQKAMQMAHRTRQVLEASGAQIAVVGRVGSDLSKHGLRYTHAGIVLREHPAGPWTFVHLLNVCGTDRSAIFDEGLVNFFLDDLFAFEAVVMVPSPALQQRFVAVVKSPLTLSMHNPAYSMIANPFSVRFQNSNQWLLELLAAAIATDPPVTTRTQAQAYLALRGFEADEISVSPLQRMGAGFTRANVHFEDHDNAELGAGRYKAVSVRSLARFLRQVDMPQQLSVIGLDGPAQPALRF